MNAWPKLVRDLMSQQLVTLRPNDELVLAENIMQLGRVRHMPVTDAENRLVGIVTQRDLFRSALVRSLGFDRKAQDRSIRGLPIKEVMTTSPRTTTPETPIGEAASVMSRHKIGCLPVLEDGKLVGILTEGDFVEEFATS